MTTPLPTTSVPTLTLDGAVLTAPQGEEQLISTPNRGAESGGEGSGSAPPGGGLGGLWMFALLGLVFWFLILGPERKARKQREAMLGALKKGDKVVTTGGLHGHVVEIRDDVVTIKAHDTRLTYSRAAIAQVQADGGSSD